MGENGFGSSRVYVKVQKAARKRGTWKATRIWYIRRSNMYGWVGVMNEEIDLKKIR